MKKSFCVFLKLLQRLIKSQQASQGDPPELPGSIREAQASFSLIGDVREEGDCRQRLRCNYTDDGSTRMHRGYSNLVK